MLYFQLLFRSMMSQALKHAAAHKTFVVTCAKLLIIVVYRLLLIIVVFVRLLMFAALQRSTFCRFLIVNGCVCKAIHHRCISLADRQGLFLHLLACSCSQRCSALHFLAWSSSRVVSARLLTHHLCLSLAARQGLYIHCLACSCCWRSSSRKRL